MRKTCLIECIYKEKKINLLFDDDCIIRDDKIKNLIVLKNPTLLSDEDVFEKNTLVYGYGLMNERKEILLQFKTDCNNIKVVSEEDIVVFLINEESEIECWHYKLAGNTFVKIFKLGDYFEVIGDGMLRCEDNGKAYIYDCSCCSVVSPEFDIINSYQIISEKKVAKAFSITERTICNKKELCSKNYLCCLIDVRGNIVSDVYDFYNDEFHNIEGSVSKYHALLRKVSHQISTEMIEKSGKIHKLLVKF